ncbi:MAG: 30S ribosomal protein S2 [bacterium]|nr:30S ribosomal protein S2 [bacterium]
MKITIPSMQDLLEAGVHFGHQVRRGNPHMREYIFGVREGVHIIDLEFSEKLLQQAAEFAYNLGKEGKVILFVGTKKQAQPIIEEAVKKVGAPYVIYKWVGGTLTNFDEIKKNIKKLTDLNEKKGKGELSRYTKKEQLLISRKLEKFDKSLGGIAQMGKLPEALFVVDCVTEKTALMEAARMKIPVIGVADTNSDPMMMAYPIPSNDDATKSIKIIVETIAKAYGEGLKEGGHITVTVSEEKPKKEEETDELKKIAEEAVSPDVAAAEEEVEKEVVAESERVV